MNKNEQKSLISLILFGGIFISVGALIFLVSVDVIHIPEEDFNAPRWVVAAIGIAFSLAGAMVMVNGLKSGYGDQPLLKWVYNGMLLIFMIVFAAPFHWVAFGLGERSFSSSVGVGGVSITQNSGGELGGRLAFGCGAIFMDLFILFIIYQIFKGKDLSDQGN